MANYVDYDYWTQGYGEGDLSQPERYVVAGYWTDGYALYEDDTATASITAQATVTALANAVRSAAGAITGNLIPAGAVTTNHIVTGSITGNLLAANIITSNNIVDGSIFGNDLGLYSVSGNNIGIGAISANNFAGGGITSNVLASNLTISTARISERINIVSGSIQGNYNVHISNTTVYMFTANATGNITFNLIANDATSTGTTGALNDLVIPGNTVSAALTVRAVNNGIKYRANVFIDGVAQQAIWLSNLQPAYYSSDNNNNMKCIISK